MPPRRRVPRRPESSYDWTTKGICNAYLKGGKQYDSTETVRICLGTHVIIKELGLVSLRSYNRKTPTYHYLYHLKIVIPITVEFVLFVLSFSLQYYLIVSDKQFKGLNFRRRRYSGAKFLFLVVPCSKQIFILAKTTIKNLLFSVKRSSNSVSK